MTRWTKEPADKGMIRAALLIAAVWFAALLVLVIAKGCK